MPPPPPPPGSSCEPSRAPCAVASAARRAGGQGLPRAMWRCGWGRGSTDGSDAPGERVRPQPWQNTHMWEVGWVVGGRGVHGRRVSRATFKAFNAFAMGVAAVELRTVTADLSVRGGS